jgi:hypothetical protein
LLADQAIKMLQEFYVCGNPTGGHWALFRCEAASHGICLWMLLLMVRNV